MAVRTEQLPREWRSQAERYLDYLRSRRSGAEDEVSTSGLSRATGVPEKEVRLVLSAVTDSGQLRSTYAPDMLIKQLERALGYHNLSNIVLLGDGALAEDLLANASFAERGFNISAAFAAKAQNRSRFRSYEELEAFCRERHIHLGIIATAAEQAEDALERLCGSGVRGIWNVSGAQLSSPKGTVLENEKFGEHEEVRENPHVSLSIKALARQLADLLGWDES